MWIGTLVLNVAAAAATVFLVVTQLRNTQTRPDDMSLMVGTLLLLGPYVWLMGVALLLRHQKWASALTFVGSLVVGAIGVWIFFTNTTFAPMPPEIVGDDLTPIVVVMLQWPGTIVLTALVLVCAFWEIPRAKPRTIT